MKGLFLFTCSNIAIFMGFFLALLKLFGVIEYINERDDEGIIDKKSSRVLISLLTSLFLVLMRLKYGFTFDFFKYVFLISYLTISAYIDFYSANIYTFISRIYGAIGVFFLFSSVYRGTDITLYIKGILITLIIAGFFTITKIMGSGDLEIFLVISLFMPGYIVAFNILVTFMLTGITAIIIFSFKFLIGKLRKGDFFIRSALGHYIAISTFLILLII